MSESLIILATSLMATFLSSMSGGGASVINIPVLLSMGIPFPLATSAQKVSSMFWVLPASYNYLKNSKIDWKFLTIFSSIGLGGVYLGTLVVISIDQRTLEISVGILILCLVVYTTFSKNAGLHQTKPYSKKRQLLSYIAAPILGFYESFFGSGNAILFSITTLKTRGFDFINSLGYYYSIVFPWQILAVIILFSKGYFELGIMMPVVIGSLIGGYFGSRYARYKGNGFIRIMFVLIGSILGIKLLIGL